VCRGDNSAVDVGHMQGERERERECLIAEEMIVAKKSPN
jgi:hypothetical protein